MTKPVKQPAWGTEKLEAPRAFAGLTSLGRFERAWTTEGKFPSAYVSLIAGASLAGIGVVLALAAQSMVAFLPLGSFGIIFLALGVWQFRAVRGAASLVARYEKGFAALVKSTVSVWPWDAITTVVTKNRYVSTKRGGYEDHCSEVSREGGETVVLLGAELADSVVLVEAIKRHVASRLLPPLQGAYDAGQPLTFGPVKVSRDSIEADGHRFHWPAIRNVVARDGRLVATPKEGKPFEVRVSRIPNVDLLFDLIGVKYTPEDLAYRW